MTVSVFSRKISLFFLILLLLTANLFAKSVTGTISYIEGYVDVYRDGKLLDWELVDIGFGIEEFDLIETGNDGIVEVDLKLPSGTSTSLSVKSNTAFYFEMDKTGGKNQTSLQMLGGSIAFKVQKLTGNDTLNIQTESAVMGVRGTEFEVITSTEGGILVLCDEGAVSCKDDQGREVYSKPGSVVDQVPGKRINAQAVSVDDLGLFRTYWVSARDKVFKNGAAVFIQGYANQFLLFEPKFADAFTELLKVKLTLEKYGKDSETGNMGSLIKAKTEVSPGIVKMRSILPVFEMVFYRLKELEKYHSKGIGVGPISDNLSSTTFFNEYGAVKEKISRQMAEVRYLFKLYKNIHDATGGGPSLLDSPFGGSGVPAANPPSSNFFGN